MKDKNKLIIKVVWANICRFLIAVVFTISGFVKAVDPLGSVYKIQDYLEAFGILSWFPSFFVFFLAISLSTIEFVIGILLLFGVRRGTATSLAVLFMSFMTPLTLYLAIANPVADCGCFGDAWILTNWQTFWKNVVLLIAAISAFKWRKLIIRFIKPTSDWVVSLYGMLFIIVLSLYCYSRLPILDFRPYKIGVNIPDGMRIPEGAKLTVYESVFALKKDGKVQEFTLDNYPDSTWTFVDARTIVKEKGYEPTIQDFSMIDQETGEDITSDVLSRKSYTFLLVAHRLEEASDNHIDLINEIYDYAVEHEYAFYCLTASPDYQIEQWKDRTGAEYPFCLMDDITLKTMIRSNPGLILMKEGTILNKWSDANLPDEYDLTDSLDKIEFGNPKDVNDSRTIRWVLLWLLAPILIVGVVDWIFVKDDKPVAEEKKGKQDSFNPLK
ncbi:BT_3928 family protein [Bacteroides sp. 224]|uniref:BT_3928 family protein n=1 Tax=Bacteroides sp. 224 TaxID=2302936 RepID=UPI0013D3AA7E|nr:BT_3928 family protein [Bacteroides sp. 224]NDV66365.1 DoxX family protein [Bacteroides sp. 224]